MEQESLAEALRVLRARRGLTVREASESIGVQWHTLRDLETGKRKASYPTLGKIAKGYDVPVEDLLALAEEPAPKATAPSPPTPPEEAVSGEERRAKVAEELKAVREDYRPTKEGLDAYCSRWEHLLEDSAKEIEDANLHEFFSIYPAFMQSLVQNLACEIADLGGAIDMLDVERLDELEALSALQPAVVRYEGIVARVSEIAEERDAETWGREGVTDIGCARRRKLEKTVQARRGA